MSNNIFLKAGYYSARESGHVLPQREMETETGKSGRTRQPASQPPTGDVTETSRSVNSVISSFTCFYFNAESLLNKRNELRLAISQHQPMIICISELLPKNCVTQMSESELNIANCKCFANLTSAKRGVCIYTHVSLSAAECRMTTDCDESVWCEVRLMGSDKLLVGCVYRSPNSNRENDVKINTTLQKANSSGYSHVLVCGDFNHPSLNWRDSTSPTDVNHPASLFMEAVRDSFLVQHVTEPTHYRGDNTPNTLDLIFTNESGMLDCLKYMAPIGKSHHSSLKMDFCCYTNASNTSKDRHIYDKGDYHSMREMMRSREWEMELSNKTVDERWTTTMGAINDATRKCTPKRRIIKKMKPIWMDEKVTAAVKRKTDAYTKYRQSREGTDYINYRRAANRVKAEVRKAVRTFEKRIATEAKKNPKAFFNYARSKMKTRTGVSDLEYPDGRMAHTDVEKAELLNTFFSQTYSQKKTCSQHLGSSREHTESHSQTSPSTTTWSQQFWID